MIFSKTHTFLWQCAALLFPAALLCGCDLDGLRMPDKCPHNVEVIYHYNLENTTGNNEFKNYIHSVTEYIFNEQGVLFRVNNLIPDVCTGEYTSSFDLPAGKYSVIFIGNDSGKNLTEDSRLGGPPRLNETLRDHLLLSLTAAATRPQGTPASDPCGNGDRLYHGYRTFSVEEGRKTTVRVDAVHSHLVLTLRVRWKGTPPPQGNYTVLLEGVGSEYGLMPEYFYDRNQCYFHEPASDDPYHCTTTDVRHHILRVWHRRNVQCHGLTLPLENGKELNGEFVSYRVRNDSHPVLSIWDSGGTQVMKYIDLQRYFRDNGFEHDMNLRQEYGIELLIDEHGNVTVSEVSPSDWEEGGAI